MGWLVLDERGSYSEDPFMLPLRDNDARSSTEDVPAAPEELSLVHYEKDTTQPYEHV